MDFISEYKKLRAQGFPTTETLEFCYMLGISEDIAAHFEIYCSENALQGKTLSSNAPTFNFGAHFDRHDKEGALFLLSKLSEREEIAIHAAYLLSSCMLRAFYPMQTDWHIQLNDVLIRLSDSHCAEIRRKSLIALGWVGTDKALPIIKKHLLNDSDCLCRAWSASAFMQMSFRNYVSHDALTDIAKGALIETLNNEQDLFVKGVAVDAAQEIWKQKFGLRQSAIDNRKEKSINNAARRALIYLSQ